MVILNQKKKTKKNPAFQIGETGKQSGKAWRRLWNKPCSVPLCPFDWEECSLMAAKCHKQRQVKCQGGELNKVPATWHYWEHSSKQIRIVMPSRKLKTGCLCHTCSGIVPLACGPVTFSYVSLFINRYVNTNLVQIYCREK